MRVIRLPALLLFCLALTQMGCVTTTPGDPPLSAYDSAAIGYVEASIAYDVALDLAVVARSQHLLTDDQWRAVADVQRSVAKAQPKARLLLNVWRLTGEKPDGWDATFAALRAEIQKLQGVTP